MVETKTDKRNNRRIKDKFSPKNHKLLGYFRGLSKSIKKYLKNK